MSGILRNLECELPIVNGVEDHVHVLCNLTKKFPLMKVLEILKKVYVGLSIFVQGFQP